jgi:hypothetical protein
MHLLFKIAKQHFFSGLSTKNFNFKMVLDLVDVYEYHSPQQNSPQNSTINPNFHFL